MQTSTSPLNLFWTPHTAATLPNFALSLVVAALLAYVLGLVYRRFGESLSNRHLFARNFLLLTVTTTLIISIVKSSLALSLGLVGALSIVRFRAAIKEPEELTYLFLAISIGLGLGAGQMTVTLLAFGVIVVLILLRALVTPRREQPNLFLTVHSCAGQKLSANQILSELAQVGATASLKRMDDTSESIEAMFRVSFPDVGKVEELSRRLRAQCEGVRISYIEDRGLAL
ncbi:MAG: DUF4956 domain-containing protein [Verrucomicrobia bacterium]|nr:DUF4956 domain-containing protein [Verrucomicrobiota bacterium]OQC65570.1 MAG: hypothetical protein BWX48_02320 [Verrucomicrobia bacterium ADurb.Bin006]MDI9380535.1 DUF4956 domain-containing protein [Verrucomicrobiota bacterium]NMD20361.1 DUF4956 domain-containing protein [Verrucomicrobiota bacterium]HOA59897.1 DUF4956 domain-containing protein [Verrucomicrobiota bacterium]